MNLQSPQLASLLVFAFNVLDAHSFKSYEIEDYGYDSYDAEGLTKLARLIWDEYKNNAYDTQFWVEYLNGLNKP